MCRLSFSSFVALAAVLTLRIGTSSLAPAQETPPAAAPATSTAGAASAAQPTIYPIAIFPFSERGKEVTDQGGKVTDILFAQLVANPDIYLVEREELKKLLQEMTISAAGLTDPKQTTQVGQLTGAKILVTGSVFQVGDKTYVVAKLIGTETSRVFGASAKGNTSDNLDGIVEALAGSIAAELKTHGGQLVPAPVRVEDRVAAMIAELGKDTPRPTVYIDASERHIGQPVPHVPDPAIETELAKICQEAGFTVIDRQKGDKHDADILLIGEGFSQFAALHETFTSVRARVELKAVDRKTGQLLAVDRQTAVSVDLSELVASKAALQDATVRLACRLLPAMLKTKAADEKKDK
jgi:TolB-like protein